MSWDGLTYDFTSAANAGPAGCSGPVGLPSSTYPALTFPMLTTGICNTLGFSWETNNGIGHPSYASLGNFNAGLYLAVNITTPSTTLSTDNASSRGTYTVSAVPEPGTTSLIVVGGGFLAAMRRRKGSRTRFAKTPTN